MNQLYLRSNKLWIVLFFIAGIFSVAYIYFTIFQGKVPKEVFKYFSASDISKERIFNMINRLIYIFSFLSELIFLYIFFFGSLAVKLEKILMSVTNNRYYISMILFFAVLWLSLNIIDLPFNLWNHYVLVQWGISVQSLSSWWSDIIKSSVIDFIISLIVIILFFTAINKWPKGWWIPVSSFLSIFMFIQVLLWPLLIAPLFNKFTPVEDPKILGIVNKISKNAGIKINRVEIMDASKRTTDANAYFYGFGKGSKIVLYDTLLKNYPLDEVEAVIAHEAGHWKENHVLKSLLLGVIGTFITVFILSFVVNDLFDFRVRKVTISAISAIYLFMLLINFDTSPIQNYVSRQMERQADILSVQYIKNKDDVIKLQVDLAKKNLLDVSTPAFIEWFSYSHPSTMNRIKYVKSTKIF